MPRVTEVSLELRSPETHEARLKGLIEHALNNLPDSQEFSFDPLLKALAKGRGSKVPIALLEKAVNGALAISAANRPEAKFLAEVKRLREFTTTASEIEGLEQEPSHLDANNTLTEGEKFRRNFERDTMTGLLEEQNADLKKSISDDLAAYGERASRLAATFQYNLDRGAPGKTGLELEAARLSVLGPELLKVAALEPNSPFALQYQKILSKKSVSEGLGLVRQIEGEGPPPSVRNFRTEVEKHKDKIFAEGTQEVGERIEKGKTVLNPQAFPPGNANIPKETLPAENTIDKIHELIAAQTDGREVSDTYTNALNDNTTAVGRLGVFFDDNSVAMVRFGAPSSQPPLWRFFF